MKAILVDKLETAQNIVTFCFRPETPIRQLAGQFTELTLQHNNQDSRGNKRWFTLSNSPGEKLITITTKINEPASSFKKQLINLRIGTQVHLAEPLGDFVLPKDSSVPLLFIAIGIGSTPFRSIIKYLQDTNQKRDITLLYGANNLDQVAFFDIFSKLEDRFKIVLSSPNKDWPGLNGKINQDMILGLIGDNEQQKIFISGPETIVETLTHELRASGINQKRIQTDYFPGYIS